MRASVVMCIDLQKTTTVTTFPKARIGDIEFKVNAGCNIGDSLPPTAMLSRGRRYTAGSRANLLPRGSSVYFRVYTYVLEKMKTATAKDLRQKTAALLDEVRRGQAVIITYRGKSVAVLSPVKKTTRKTLHPAGFGIWRGRKDMRSVEKWLSKLRRPRYRT